MNASIQIAEPLVLDCEQTVRRLWDYLDRQLPAVDMHAVDQHLRDCQHKCASHFAFERAFLDVLRTARPRVVTSDALRLRVTSLLTQGDFPTHDKDA
jgi:predicted anti-sigma-YlaC factor YlaD